MGNGSTYSILDQLRTFEAIEFPTQRWGATDVNLFELLGHVLVAFGFDPTTLNLHVTIICCVFDPTTLSLQVTIY